MGIRNKLSRRSKLGKQIKILLTIIIFYFLSIKSIFPTAQIRNLTVSGNCYNPGQNIMVSFEVRTTTVLASIFGSILFSKDAIADWNDDAVWTDGGVQYPPDNNGHFGIIMQYPFLSYSWTQKSYVGSNR